MVCHCQERSNRELYMAGILMCDCFVPRQWHKTMLVFQTETVFDSNKHKMLHFLTFFYWFFNKNWAKKTCFLVIFDAFWVNLRSKSNLIMPFLVLLRPLLGWKSVSTVPSVSLFHGAVRIKKPLYTRYNGLKNYDNQYSLWPNTKVLVGYGNFVNSAHKGCGTQGIDTRGIHESFADLVVWTDHGIL